VSALDLGTHARLVLAKQVANSTSSFSTNSDGASDDRTRNMHVLSVILIFTWVEGLGFDGSQEDTEWQRNIIIVHVVNASI
jgi:hypothetical protein